MKRSIAVALALVCGIPACNKPSAEDCRAALENMKRILGTAEPGETKADLEPDVRACRGSSKKAAVECAMKATSEADLKACGFMANVKPRPPATGSGSAGSGSAGSGSAGSGT